MDSFFQNIFQVIFIIGYLLVFVISIIILRPFRLHKKRRKSTISIKFSYIFYLAIFLIFTYLLLFGDKELAEDEKPYDTLFNGYFLLFLTSTIVPNVGIMLRKKVQKKRIRYNIIFTIVNSLYFLFLLYLCLSRKWALF